jgi:Leucine Rich repeat
MAALCGGDEVVEWRAELDEVVQWGGQEVLDLMNMSIGDTGAVEVAEKLGGGSNKVRGLYLSNNGISDVGAAAIAELLRGDKIVEDVTLAWNDIGADGMAALADALRHNTTLRDLKVFGNRGVDPERGTEAEVAAGVESLLAAIAVNTTLERVVVNDFSPQKKAINKALADREGRRFGREQFLFGPTTKAARPQDGAPVGPPEPRPSTNVASDTSEPDDESDDMGFGLFDVRLTPVSLVSTCTIRIVSPDSILFFFSPLPLLFAVKCTSLYRRRILS